MTNVFNNGFLFDKWVTRKESVLAVASGFLKLMLRTEAEENRRMRMQRTRSAINKPRTST